MSNYYRAVILLFRWIVASTGPVTALGRLTLDLNQQLTMTKTLNAWEALRRRKLQKAKRAGADHNRLEKMQFNNHWTSVAAVIRALDEIVTPRLQSLVSRDSLEFDEMCEFFELLMFSLMVKRPCRPCTYYSSYDNHSPHCTRHAHISELLTIRSPSHAQRRWRLVECAARI